MDFRFRLLVTACALVLVAGVISAFTFDDGGQDVSSDADTEPFAAGDNDEEVVAADSTTTTEADDADTDETEPDETSTTEPAVTTTSTTQPQATTTAAAPPTTVALGVTPTTPGTYTYDISGTVDGKPVSGSSKLTVPEADENGRQAQTRSGPEGSSTTTYRFTPEGTYLESMSMSARGQNITLSATAPFLVIPADATQGTTSSGQLKGSGLTANVTFTLVEVGPDSAVASIEAKVSGVAGGLCSVNGTMNSTITARSSDQLPISTEGRTNVSTCLGKVNSDTQTTLQE